MGLSHSTVGVQQAVTLSFIGERTFQGKMKNSKAKGRSLFLINTYSYFQQNGLINQPNLTFFKSVINVRTSNVA